jgi:transposase
MGWVVSDTTLRARRDEWVAAGVFDALAEEAIAGLDRITGLDLTEVGLDGSAHKAPCGGEGTGPNPVDRGKRGWKWSLAVDANGVPIGWAIDGANRQDCKLLQPTLEAVSTRGLTEEIESIHLDRGYDHAFVVELLDDAGITDINISRRRPPGHPHAGRPAPLGLRWIVERTNSWLARYGQLRRNTDRHPIHRLAALALAVAALITGKLIAWRNRWNPKPRPIR